jgi:chemotaxis protein MotA
MAAIVGLVCAAAVVVICVVVATLWGDRSDAIRWVVKAFADLDLVRGADGKLHAGWLFTPGCTNIFPISIQALTFAAFGMACALLWQRRGIYRRELAATMANLLPEDERTLIQPCDIAARREPLATYKSSVLVTLIERALQQYQTTLSTSEAATIVNATTDVFHEELDGNYAVIKYLAWAIPALGFVGTVLGIGRALTGFGNPGADLPIAFITSNLATAFDTTLVALLLSLVLMLLISVTQAREDAVITRAHDYTLANLVNRLFNPEHLTR